MIDRDGVGPRFGNIDACARGPCVGWNSSDVERPASGQEATGVIGVERNGNQPVRTPNTVHQHIEPRRANRAGAPCWSSDLHWERPLGRSVSTGPDPKRHVTASITCWTKWEERYISGRFSLINTNFFAENAFSSLKFQILSQNCVCAICRSLTGGDPKSYLIPPLKAGMPRHAHLSDLSPDNPQEISSPAWKMACRR